jgi:hypothetical protein
MNSYDLAGGNATLSVELANSLLTTVTWTASYATTADTFGTIGTPTKTQIATGTFTVNSTVTNYTAPIAIPAAATTGIEILLTVGAQTSGTWTIGNMQLEAGSVATPFERRDYGRELIMCQRYFELVTTTAAGVASTVYLNRLYQWPIRFAVVKRATPTIAYSNTTTNRCSSTGAGNVTTGGFSLLLNNTTNDGDDFTFIFTAAASSEL